MLLAPPPPPLALTGEGNRWWMEVTADCVPPTPPPSTAATAVAAFLGEPPFCDSVDGVGLSVTECACRDREFRMLYSPGTRNNFCRALYIPWVLYI